MLSCKIDFTGFWPVRAQGAGVASHPGVYCVFASTPSSSRPIYIGQSLNAGSRVSGHPGMDDWELAADGHPLHFSVGSFRSPDNAHVAEAALIHHLKPVCNTLHKYDFPYPDTAIEMTGPVGFMNQTFTVRGR